LDAICGLLPRKCQPQALSRKMQKIIRDFFIGFSF
jgi:hypothetical protein